MSTVELIFTPEELEHNLEMLAKAETFRNFSSMVLRLSESVAFQHMVVRSVVMSQNANHAIPYAKDAFLLAIGYACGQRAAEARTLTLLMPAEPPAPIAADELKAQTFDGALFDADVTSYLSQESSVRDLIADQFMEHCAQSKLFAKVVFESVQAVVRGQTDASGMLVTAMLLAYRSGFHQGYLQAKKEEPKNG